MIPSTLRLVSPGVRAHLLHATICATLAAGFIGANAHAQSSGKDALEAAFMAENGQAMTTMMDRMAVKPTGDIDRDFVAMMQPHHQGAIDMAEAELRYGHNEQLRRIAQEIIVDQQQEITAMSVAIGQPLPPSSPAPTQPGATAAPSTPAASMPMSMSMPMPAQDK